MKKEPKYHHNYKVGYRNEIPTLCMEFGLLPRGADSLAFSGNNRSKKGRESLRSAKIKKKELLDDGLLARINTKPRDPFNAVIINPDRESPDENNEVFAFERDVMAGKAVESYEMYGEKVSKEMQWESIEKRVKERYTRIAWAACFFYGTKGVNVLCSEKEEFPGKRKEGSGDYYLPHEISDRAGTALGSSRSLGYLIDFSNVYAIYIAKMSSDAKLTGTEWYAKAVLDKKRKETGRNGKTYGIILYSDKKDFQGYVAGKSKSQSRLALSDVYGSDAYLVPLTPDGQRFMELIMRMDPSGNNLPFEERMLKFSIREEERRRESIGNQGKTEEGENILSFLVPSMDRLVKFLALAQNKPEEKFIIRCFGFQREVLDGLVPPNVSFKVWNFDKVYAAWTTGAGY